MPSAAQVEALAAHLHDLRSSKLPIDMPKIERILIALLEAVLSDDPQRQPSERADITGTR